MKSDGAKEGALSSGLRARSQQRPSPRRPPSPITAHRQHHLRSRQQGRASPGFCLGVCSNRRNRGTRRGAWREKRRGKERRDGGGRSLARLSRGPIRPSTGVGERKFSPQAALNHRPHSPHLHRPPPRSASTPSIPLVSSALIHTKTLRQLHNHRRSRCTFNTV